MKDNNSQGKPAIPANKKIIDPDKKHIRLTINELRLAMTGYAHY
jgi:hypothetical protein